MLDRTPEDISEYMPEDMPDRMPEDLLVRKYINVMVGIARNKIILFFFGIMVVCLILIIVVVQHLKYKSKFKKNY